MVLVMQSEKRGVKIGPTLVLQGLMYLLVPIYELLCSTFIATFVSRIKILHRITPSRHVRVKLGNSVNSSELSTRALSTVPQMPCLERRSPGICILDPGDPKRHTSINDLGASNHRTRHSSRSPLHINTLCQFILMFFLRFPVVFFVLHLCA